MPENQINDNSSSITGGFLVDAAALRPYRAAPKEWRRPTFEEFLAQYRRGGPMTTPWWRFLSVLRWNTWTERVEWRWPDWYGVAFALRLRVPNITGHYGSTREDRTPVVGAQWCWPWQWYRRYYAVRFGERDLFQRRIDAARLLVD